MCQLFINGDHKLWANSTRSLRIDGVVTSIRLENFFWNTLQEISLRENLTITKMITKLYFESLKADIDIVNFTSFLRICCSRYLSLIADGNLQRDTSLALDNIDTENLLKKEQISIKKRLSTESHRRYRLA